MLVGKSPRGRDVCLWPVSSKTIAIITSQHTDIDEKGTILLLIDNVVVQDLVVQGLGLLVCARHEGQRRAESLVIQDNSNNSLS